MKTWPRGSGSIQDQLLRAIASVVLNTAEGNGRQGPKDRRRFFEIAKASACESAAVLDLAEAYGWISPEQHAVLSDELLQIVKILAKLQ